MLCGNLTILSFPVALKDTGLGVVISGGGWHTPPLYASFMQALGQNGIKAYAPLVPTVNVVQNDVTNETDPVFSIAEPPEGWPTPDDDAAAIEEDVVALIAQGRKVIIIGHSNGGMAATQAAKPELHAAARAERGLKGGVIGILYVSAYLLPVGIAVNEIVGEAVVPPFARLHKHMKAGFSTPIRMHEFFFARIPLEEANYYSKFMRAQPIPRSKLTNDPYKTYPLGYVICEEDVALVPEAQEQMIAAKIKDGISLKLYREPFDHCPTISAIDRMVEIVLDFGISAQAAL